MMLCFIGIMSKPSFSKCWVGGRVCTVSEVVEWVIMPFFEDIGVPSITKSLTGDIFLIVGILNCEIK